MALDWEKIIIIDDDEVIEGEDETVMIFASGVPGSSATVEVVGTETLEPTEDAYVENLGTNQNVKLKFGIPHGASGVWGGIAGEIDNQADLKAKFDNVYTKAEADALLDEKLDDLADQTKTGGIVEFDAKTDHAIKDLTVSIDPVQDLHGYDNPWPAGGNSNIWDEQWEVGSISGADGQNDSANDRIRSKNYISVTPSTQYYIHGTMDLFYYDSSKVYIGNTTGVSNTTATVSDTCAYIRFRCPTSYGTTYNNDIAINYPATVTTYSPYANICPISGHTQAVVTRTGKNLVCKKIQSSNIGSNGEIVYEPSYSSFVGGIKKGQTYTVTTIEAGNGCVLGFYENNPDVGSVSYDGTRHPLNTKTFIAPITGYVAFRSIQPDYTDAQLELGSSVSAYEAPHVQSVTIDLDGTRYGGSLDVTTGVLTVTKGIISDLSQLTWIQHGARTTAYYATSDTLNLKTYNNMISSALKGVPATTAVGSMPDNSVRSDQTADNYIYVNSTIASNVPSFTASMSGVQLVYELATPVTVTLTPAEVASLIGHNVLWCDTGNSTVVLRLTTGDLAYQDYIDYTSSQLKNKPTLGTMASKNDASSDTKAYGRKDGAWYDLDGRYYTESEVDDKLADKADIIHRSAEGGDIVHITDGSPYPVDALKVGIEPVQNLHGYDAPWPAGGGKNLLWLDLATIKSINNGGTWTGNSYVHNGVTFKVNQDADGNIISFDVSGASNSNIAFLLLENRNTYNAHPITSNGAYVISGSVTPVNVTAQLFDDDTLHTITSVDGDSATYTYTNIPTITGNNNIYLYVNPNKSITGTVTVKPQLEKGSTATTYAQSSNVCPISGWSNAKIYRTRKNLLPNEITSAVTEKDVTFEPTADGGIYIHGTNSGNVWQTRICANLSLKAGDYVISIGNNLPANALVQIVNRVENKAYVSVLSSETYKSFTVTKEMENDMRVRFATSGTVAFNNTVYPMIRLASESDSTYESYNGTSVTVNLNGTRYGGTLDVVNGVLTVDRAMIALDNRGTWQKSISYPGGFYMDIGNGIKYHYGALFKVQTPFICSHAKTAYSLAEYLEGTCYCDNSMNIRIMDADTTAQQWQQYLQDQYDAGTPVEVCAYLATPQTVTLTPAQLSTILGENYIYCDTGSIKELCYRADTEIYNEQHFARKSSEIVETASGGLVHITDAAELPVEGLKVGVECTQDLHGYDSPWPAGGGKNLLPMTLSMLKSVNSYGTWSGNTCVINDITYTVTLNNEGYAIKITANGTASTNAPFCLSTTESHNEWLGLICNGCPSGGSGSTYFIGGWNATDGVGLGISDTGSGFTIPSNVENKNWRLYIGISTGATVTNKDFYPMLRLSSVTDATFTPYSNICPITGRTSAKVTRAGKNLWTNGKYTHTNTDVTFTPVSNGIKANGTATANWNYYFIENTVSINNAYFLSAGTYTYSLSLVSGTTSNLAGGYGFFYWKKSNMSVRMAEQIGMSASSKTFTLAEDAYIHPFFYVTSGSVLNDAVFGFQLEHGSTATAYEPYQGTSVTIDLGGTRYGGLLNVTTGELTVDRTLSIYNGTESWYPSYQETYVEYSHAVSSAGYEGSESSINNMFPLITWNQRGSVAGLVSYNDSSYRFCPSLVMGLDTVDKWKTWLSANNIQIALKLKNPVTVTLTPAQMSLLLGENNVWSDTGNTEVTYIADSKMYIDKKFAELQALILEN